MVRHPPAARLAPRRAAPCPALAPQLPAHARARHALPPRLRRSTLYALRACAPACHLRTLHASAALTQCTCRRFAVAAPSLRSPQARSLLPEEALEALWLEAVAAYDTGPNPPPDFASVAATRAALAASGLADMRAFEVAVVAVLGRAMHERGDATLLDYDQARRLGHAEMQCACVWML
jgi:hypothetical protein